MNSYHTPARKYIKGIGEAVADRTINRKMIRYLEEVEIKDIVVKRHDDAALDDTVKAYCRSNGLVIDKYDIIYEGETTITVSAHIIAKEDTEDWEDVAYRVAKGNISLVDIDKLEEFHSLHHHLRQASILMSGRHLQHGDENQHERPMEVFTNCSTSATSFLSFYLLLNGSGVGRTYDNIMMKVDYKNLPIVVSVLDKSHADALSGEITVIDMPDAEHLYLGRTIHKFEVPDSREGWAKALEKMEIMAFEEKYRQDVLILDFSKVRPRGAPIGGMQDRPASGPAPLMAAIGRIARLRDTNMDLWRQAMYADHYLSECVLVGGARRAARMSTKTWRDKNVLDFIEVKRGGHLWSSNNSVTVDADFWWLVNQEDSDDKLWEHANAVLDAVTKASYYDGTGEPGFINQDKLTQNDTGLSNYEDGKFAESHRYKLESETLALTKSLALATTKCQYNMITNPCVTGDTWINTSEGYKKVTELLSESYIAVVQGNEYRSTPFWSTGIKKVFEIVTKSGNTLKATADHKILVNTYGRVNEWVEIQNLLVNAEIVLGSGYISELARWEYIGEEEVYDCTVEEVHRFDANGIIAHNCGEITLIALGGYCVIADVVPYHAQGNKGSDLSWDNEVEDAFRTATRALIRTNTMDCLYKPEVERTNRIGVGFTGLHEYAWARYGYGFRDIIDEEKAQDFWQNMSRFKRAVKEEAKEYSELLGMVAPHTDTTVKPAGTTSKLFGLTEGAHLPSMREYIRWVQFRHDDPLIEEYKAKGYPVRELKIYAGTTIVGFPTKPVVCGLGMKDKLVTAAEATPEEQYQYLRLLEKYWIRGVDVDGVTPLEESGNQVSYTLKYDPTKVSYDEFCKTLKEGQSTIRCCSVMPQADTTAYEYQPEEQVTKAKYEAICEALLDQETKEDVDRQHVACEGGACPIDFNKE